MYSSALPLATPEAFRVELQLNSDSTRVLYPILGPVDLLRSVQFVFIGHLNVKYNKFLDFQLH